MSSQTTRTSSPHHLLYRLEGKDDVLTVCRARGGGVRLCVNKVFTAAILDVYSHVVSWRARATRSCKWPNSPNFPSAAGGLLLAGGGAALRPATASAAPRSRLAGKWVSVQRTAVQRLYSARLYTHPAYLQCNLLKSNCVELAAVGLYKHPPPARARQSGMYLFIFKCSSV